MKIRPSSLSRQRAARGRARHLIRLGDLRFGDPAASRQLARADLAADDLRSLEVEPSRLERILAEHGQRWQIERDGSVWTATEHPSPPALHVTVAHDLGALEQKLIGAELAS